MDRLNAMHLFLRVAELGSFSAVAQQLGVARSVVTRQIAALEKHLGIKLLARSTRRLTLTSAGNRYLEQCRTILDLVEYAEAELYDERQVPRGRIRISVPLSYGLKHLSPMLLDFSQQYPATQLEMDFSDRPVKLIEEGFDLSIRITATLAPGDIVRKLGVATRIVAAAPEWLNKHGRPAHPHELSRHDCLVYAPHGGTQSWPFMIDGRVQQISVRGRLHANNGDVLAQAAAAGMGITMQPEFIASDYIARGRLEPLLTPYAAPPLGIYAVLPDNLYIPQRVQALLRFLADRLDPARTPQPK